MERPNPTSEDINVGLRDCGKKKGARGSGNTVSCVSLLPPVGQRNPDQEERNLPEKSSGTPRPEGSLLASSVWVLRGDCLKGWLLNDLIIRVW